MVGVELVEENPEVKLHTQLVSKAKTKLPIPDNYKIQEVETSTKHIFILARKSAAPLQKKASNTWGAAKSMWDLSDSDDSAPKPPKIVRDKKTNFAGPTKQKTPEQKASEKKAAADSEKKMNKTLEKEFNWDDP